MPEFRFSVIMPCHNAERYVEQALKSAATQTLPPHQIIAVNDNSSDNSAQVIRQSGVDVTLLETSFKNAAAARNHGLERATGDWIAFLDADDYWYPHHLEEAAKRLEGSNDVGYTALDDYLFNDGSMLKTPNRWPITQATNGLTPDDYVRCWRKYFKFAMGPTVVRRDRFEAVGGFNVEQRRRHDFEMWLRVIHGHTWAYNPMPVTVYRCESVGSISRENVPEAEWYRLRALSLNVDRYNTEDYRQIIRGVARGAIATALTDGTPEERKKALSLGWPHLSVSQKLVFAAGALMPGVFGAINRRRRERALAQAAASEPRTNTP
ncbi:glycosyltransferase family 2 protein [Mucisphaera calidilacus]|uniref:UDP-Glc:alpha-D-GlcNAc-diphosphoundecaprenol beta-1,3-glucosyltransferase WfgD n=1 Tax=Mucisphaera calidilacus TaxID=2527982 RepID=A0A518BVB6_9BACT|nr:glycosyltransferase family A protein [Mucisphaera calidilacus]QDU70916.1 UDP-Glc:alpha-D-GlcNAc-diphosphoundecaprenol beta-1,3-glucosyltransferase WfgD [Mucisphaera calidilacus]